MRMKHYRYLNDSIKILGQRLDGARSALARSKTDWARTHWSQVIENLLAQWHLLPVLHDCDAVFTDRPRWKIDYNFIEGNLNEPNSWISSLYNHRDLNWSWDNNRNQRLMKSQ